MNRILVCGLLLALSRTLSAAPLGTAFTYQGRLFDQNTLANGPYELRFGLYDATIAGTRLGPLLTNTAVAVSNGVFTVTLDFGVGAFGNAARWLELGVRPGGSTAAFVPLDSRQPLTPVPQALYAPTAGAAATAITATTATTANSLAATAVVPGTLPWQAVAGTTQTAQSNQGYVLTNAAPVTVTLPANPKVGDVVRINGVGSGGWTAAPSATQSIGDPPGVTWTPRGPSANWSSVASSSDGTKLIASVDGGTLWTSTDSGVTWTPRGGSATWISVASSADGTKLIAAAINGTLWTSTDSGGSWTSHSGVANWRSVASSADGTRLVATSLPVGTQGLPGLIVTSADSGVTWTPTGGSALWVSVASSADGTKLIAAATGGPLWISTNSGQTWLSRGNSASWSSVASSADGSKLIAAGNNTTLWTSADSGVTWTSSLTPANWASVASSSDGAKLIAAANAGLLWTSTDSGLTWTPRASSTRWSSVASSSDGSKLVVCSRTQGAVGIPGQLWTSSGFTPGKVLTGMGGTSVGFQYVGNNRWITIPDLSDNSVNTAKLADGSVNTAKLLDGSVTGVKLADNSVASSKLVSDAASLNRVSGGMATIAGNQLGLGVTSPQATLHVRPNSGAGDALILGANSYSGGFTTLNLGLSNEKGGFAYLQAVQSSGSAYGDLSLNPNGGNILIQGDVLVGGTIWGNFGGAYYSLGQGPNGVATWSDRRLKQDITPIEGAIAAVKKLRGVTYHWNETGLGFLNRDIESKWQSASRTPDANRQLWDEKRREANAQNSRLQMGFVAQEVEQVFPDWVKTDADGFKQIDMSRLNAVLVNALHEQQDQIEAQQQRMAGQEDKFTALRSEVTELRRLMQHFMAVAGGHSDSPVANLTPGTHTTSTGN